MTAVLNMLGENLQHFAQRRRSSRKFHRLQRLRSIAGRDVNRLCLQSIDKRFCVMCNFGEVCRPAAGIRFQWRRELLQVQQARPNIQGRMLAFNFWIAL